MTPKLAKYYEKRYVSGKKQYIGACGELFLRHHWCMEVMVMGKGQERWSGWFTILITNIFKDCYLQYSNFLGLSDEQSAIVCAVISVHALGKQVDIKIVCFHLRKGLFFNLFYWFFFFQNSFHQIGCNSCTQQGSRIAPDPSLLHFCSIAMCIKIYSNHGFLFLLIWVVLTV